MKAWNHFKTITEHKYLVMKYCFSVGLYKQGILHDLSKYSYTEFRIGAKYYQGYRSPNAAERNEFGFSTAWLHHKGRNKHHFEYWIDFSIHKEEGLVGMNMPTKYVVEMFLDRIAACRIYEKEAYTDKSPLRYYNLTKTIIVMHKDTRKLLEFLMKMLEERGEKATFGYIKNELLK